MAKRRNNYKSQNYIINRPHTNNGLNEELNNELFMAIESGHFIRKEKKSGPDRATNTARITISNDKYSRISIKADVGMNGVAYQITDNFIVFEQDETGYAISSNTKECCYIRVPQLLEEKWYEKEFPLHFSTRNGKRVFYICLAEGRA